jgi:ABC-type lipoprotein export system ATPase subunit
MTKTIAVDIQNVKRVYGAGSQAIHALRGINLQIEAGQFMALKGRSGSGKTTLLNCIGGLDKPTTGTMHVYGRALATLSDEELTQWRATQVGFVFQSFGLLPTLSAYENVELMLRIADIPRKERKARALRCLELVGLSHWTDHRPPELSGGQQQRVSIARAIANTPRLILADEATGELDSETSREILNLFQTIVKEEKITLLLASHDGLVDEYVDKVLILEDGAIDAAGAASPGYV